MNEECEKLSIASCSIRGYHVFKAAWNHTIWAKYSRASGKPTNTIDRYAVSVMKEGVVVDLTFCVSKFGVLSSWVKYVPASISAYTVTCFVWGNHQWQAIKKSNLQYARCIDYGRWGEWESSNFFYVALSESSSSLNNLSPLQLYTNHTKNVSDNIAVVR